MTTASLNQTFSAQNLRRISEKEKRRGRIRDLNWFEAVRNKTEELKSAIGATKEFRRQHPGKYSDAQQTEFNHLRELREEKRKERDEVLLQNLEEVSKTINRRNFEVSISQVSGPLEKPVYVIDKNLPDQFYALKKLELNISALYKVKPANRDEVMKQLIGILSDKFNYHILRTDIESFFESIPHDRLREKLKTDQLLNQKSLKIMSSILFRYGNLARTPGVGLPRGLGVSSYLSELYMRDFDEHIKMLPHVVYYARYVDDIVIVFAPLPGTDNRSKRARVEELLSENSLKMNRQLEKTKESPLDNDGQLAPKIGWGFEYLGYRLDFRSNLSVTMSRKRLARYKNRIYASFDRYESQRAKNPKRAYRILLKRIRFLTSNTQLTHNKSNAYVGIYFNNMHITDLGNLQELDAFLKARSSRVFSASLKAKLAEYSFEKGHQQRIFRRFHKKDELKEIVKAWKYEE